jgi:outer membrane lipoprotein SlyB
MINSQEVNMNKLKIFMLSITLLLVATSCASYRPIVDMKGIDRNQYERDLAECQAYAEQVNVGGEAATGPLIGGAFGAAMGLAIGALLGDPGEGAALGAVIGGGSGLASGAAEGAGGQIDVIRNCMMGRGYRVLR